MSLQHAEIVQLNLPARMTYLHLLGDCIADMLGHVGSIDDAEMITYNAQLAAHEVCTNIVTHAYAGRLNGDGRIEVVLALYLDPLRLEIKLRDNGRSFDPALVPSPNLEEAQIHGYGLFLIHSLMDKVTYTAQADCNQWCLVKQL